MMINELPPDQYNVVVENDMDNARLLWLVNEISEDKLRKSVAKYQARYPGCQPFVSTMLKRFGRTVPVEVYAPKPIPVYWLYLLSLKDSPKVKVGFTGHWPQRAFAFLPGPRYFPVRTDLPDLLYPAVRQAALLDLFDGDRSFAYLVGNDRKEAAGREAAAKKQFSVWGTEPPHMRHHGGGDTEWFDAQITDQFRQLATSFDPAPVVLTLRATLDALNAAGEPCAPMWARYGLM